MRKLIVFAMLLLGLTSCSKDGEVNDTQKPIISSVTISDSGIIYNNKAATIAVTLEDNGVEVTSVEFYINGELKKTVFAEPFNYDDTFTDLNTGDYEVSVIAKDGNNEQSQSSANFTFKVQLKDDYQGGLVIKTDDGISGVIAAKTDLNGGVAGLYKYGAYNGNYEAYSMDNGLSNTDKFQGKNDANYAAIACLSLELNGYDDWYLPAFNELLVFDDYLEELNIPERSGYKYWSSTGDKDDATKGYIHAFGVSYKNPFDIQDYCRVRPCRRFGDEQ